MVVLDTSALSAVMHRDPDGLNRLKEYDPSAVVLCAPVAAEIRFGLARLKANSRRRRLLTQEYEAIRSVARWSDWTESAADLFGQIKATLQEKGKPVEDFDLAIASVAIHLEATVATRNSRHFLRIDGLSVDNWLS